MAAGRDFLTDIEAQNNAYEREFVEWIESYNGQGDLDILEAFGDTMKALDRLIDCGWGCDADHPEKHLLAICVSRIRAIHRLIACGYPSEASALVRPLGETVNLMALLAASRDEFEAYRLGSNRQRRKRFSANNVRGMLKREGLMVPQSARMYGALSDFYLHPNALDHVFPHRTSHERNIVIPYFHRDLCITVFLVQVVAATTAHLFWACARDDDGDFLLAHALQERTDDAVRAFVAKLAQDPTVERVPVVEGARQA